MNLLNLNTPDKTILVPLTNSLYVPGKLVDPEHVIVDIGTGYYVKKVRRLPSFHYDDPDQNKTRAQALKLYNDKIEYIRTNADKLEDTIQKKRDNMNVVISILQQKIAQETAGGPQGSRRS
jgi:prefoldin alpha subunit